MATIIYCFSKFKSTIREIENLCQFDIRVMYLMEQEQPSHNFHAGYNIQVMVSSGIITMYGVFPNRDDFYTFIPMNNLYYQYYKEYPKKNVLIQVMECVKIINI